ncbi:MAG: hypothetical protein AAF198_04790 [Pseudomonadota bacterium]
MEKSTNVRVFRVVVALLTTFYFMLPLFDSGESFVVRPKFLTLWGLYGSFAVSLLMLGRSFGWVERRFDGFVSMVIVLNILVVFLYWRLYFEDPALVNASGAIVWWKEYYLHLGCQILMWIDAFFIFGAWRKIWSGLIWLVGIIIGYSTLIEVWVQPRNTFPSGTVTDGLPYPFLNDMVFVERITFYGTTAVTSAVFALVTIGLALLLGRLNKQS